MRRFGSILKEICIKLFRRNPAYRLQYARKLWLAGPSESVVLAFKKAIEYDPENYLAYFDLGNVYQDRKEHRNAVVMFESTLKINSEFWRAYFTLGNAYMDLGRYENATIAFEKAIYFSKHKLIACDNENVVGINDYFPEFAVTSAFDFKQFRLENLDRVSKAALSRVRAKSEVLRRLQTIQAEYNFPLMLLATLFVIDLCKKKKINRIELCSRDCNLWRHIFDKIISVTDLELEVNYYYTSRITRTRPSPTYLRYARERLQKNTLVVDLCGTGDSFTKLADLLDLGKIDFFVLHKLPSNMKILPEAKENTVNIHYIFEHEPYLDNRKLEWANYADYPSCNDMEFSNNEFSPTFLDETRGADELVAVKLQQEVFHRAVEALDQESFYELLNVDHDTLRDLAKTLYQKLSACQELQIFELTFALEESRILAKIF